MQLTLKQARQLKGWTLEHLAEISGVSKGTLSRLERGETEPYYSTARAIEDALGVKPCSLIFPHIVGAKR